MKLTRREALGLGGAAAFSALTPNVEALPYRRPRRTIRIAHLTDIHVQPELGAPKGMERCLEHAQSQNPDLIITGGDMVMDCQNADGSRTKSQWDIFGRVLMANLATPIRHCIGNHDVWGWTNPSVSKNEPKYGKRYAMDRLELDKPYYSFSEAGWHFIVLDSTQPRRGGYTAALDEAQFQWLQNDLAQTRSTKPVMVVSHIPIVSACAFFHGDNERLGSWQLPCQWMHKDARRIKDLFRKYPNVKLCISGHIHLTDVVKYLGVTYVCNGSASGAWWKGNFQECRNGYAVIDLYDDGSFRNHYVDYGWKTMA